VRAMPPPKNVTAAGRLLTGLRGARRTSGNLARAWIGCPQASSLLVRAQRRFPWLPPEPMIRPA